MRAQPALATGAWILAQRAGEIPVTTVTLNLVLDLPWLPAFSSDRRTLDYVVPWRGISIELDPTTFSDSGYGNTLHRDRKASGHALSDTDEKLTTKAS